MDIAEEDEAAGGSLRATGGREVFSLPMVGVDVVEAAEFCLHFRDLVLELEEEAVVEGREAAVNGVEVRGGLAMAKVGGE